MKFQRLKSTDPHGLRDKTDNVLVHEDFAIVCPGNQGGNGFACIQIQLIGLDVAGKIVEAVAVDILAATERIAGAGRINLGRCIQTCELKTAIGTTPLFPA